MPAPSTREPQRDEHLRSADFFEVEKFPTIEFKSTRIAKTGSETYGLTGQLTMHGITREITLTVESDGVETKDFGLNWNQALETGGILVGEEVKISIDVELVRSA